MSTVNDIVTGALRLCGIRDTTDSTILSDGLTALNTMIASWEAILHYAPTEENFTLTAGTESYTIGSGGDFDTERPSRIISMFIRDSDSNDHMVDLISKRDYDRIYDKDASARPDQCYYAKENTLGILYFNKAPSDAETLYITSIKPFAAYSALTDTLTFPIEYEKALKYNLALDLAPEHNIQLSQTVIEQSVFLKTEIERLNSNPIPLAEYDLALLR